MADKSHNMRIRELPEKKLKLTTSCIDPVELIAQDVGTKNINKLK